MTNPTSTDVVLTPKVIGLSIAIGVVGSFFGFTFLEIATSGQRILFTELPEHFGFDQAPWWWITAVLLLGATVVFLAHKLPGKAGEGPLNGFHFDEPPSKAPGILLAAFGTLLFGFVLGLKHQSLFWEPPSARSWCANSNQVLSHLPCFSVDWQLSAPCLEIRSLRFSWFSSSSLSAQPPQQSSSPD